jgi:hypothetical protein
LQGDAVISSGFLIYRRVQDADGGIALAGIDKGDGE